MGQNKILFMNKKMIKVLWIFLIFALTSNTKSFASAIDRSLSIAAIPVISSDCDSTDLYSPHFSVIPVPLSAGSTPAGIKSFGVSVQTRTKKIKSIHPTKKLSSPGSAIADTGSSSLTFKCVSIDSIQQSKVTSNHLSDIFIPPKITI